MQHYGSLYDIRRIRKRPFENTLHRALLQLRKITLFDGGGVRNGRRILAIERELKGNERTYALAIVLRGVVTLQRCGGKPTLLVIRPKRGECAGLAEPVGLILI